MSKKHHETGGPMRIGDIERIVENKYSLLLFFLVALNATSIFTIGHIVLNFCLESVLAMVVFIIMLRILKAPRRLFHFFVVLAFTALLFHYLFIFLLHSRSVGIAAMLVYILMIGAIIMFMIRRIFSERLVTGDTIKGGISVYILLGVWWQLIYILIWTLDPEAFKSAAGVIGRADFSYYSITTMTTLGYGDIVPITRSAKMFSSAQALVGQLYVAVFVARLVGLHVAVHSSKK